MKSESIMRMATVTVVALGVLILGGCESASGSADVASASQAPLSGGPEGVPQFRVDPFWPQPLPENWILGQVAGLSVDTDDDHIWIVHRQSTVQDVNAGAAADPPIAMCCVPAPPVIEFDPAGNVVRAWGGPSDTHDWPTSMHGIHVDYNDNVWLAGNGPDDHFVLKFTKDGEFIMQIGRAGQNTGSADTNNLGGPATLLVDPATNELYVADGYQNRRIVVFDAETGEFKRSWGAYGEPPTDENPGPYDPGAAPSRSWRTPVHGLIIANDGLVYVSDRPSNRIQVFQKDGTYVRESFIRPETLGPGSTWYFGLSRDPEQQWLYVPDGTNNVIWILDRSTLEVVHYFGRGGRAPGQFDWLHDLVVDSRGNLFTTEVQTGHRVQKFEIVE